MAVIVPPLVFPVDVFALVLAQVLRSSGASGLRVTSWLRTEQKQLELLERGRGVVRSLHLKGLAMDLVGTPAAIAAFQRGWIGLGLDAVLEADHLHVELDGPALRRIGLDFR